MIWYKNNNSDIVVSTRIRLARNVDKTPFPNALKDTKEVTEKIKNAVLGGNSTLAKDFDFIDLDNTPLIRKQELAEEHLISPVMCEGKGKSVMISKDRTMSIMLMEEDHIRLQIIKDGFALDEAYSLASKVDDVIESGVNADIKTGNALPLRSIPVGTMVHNIELHPGKGGQMVRSAGNGAQLMAKEGKYATLRLPSGEMRMVPIVCRASVGVVGNGDHNLINIGKAGRKRNMGIRPTVRGSVMNPNDHPHGGGEGKTGIGRPGPCTPWGKPALGLKTRKKNKPSNKLIVRRRDGKALSK